MSIEKEPLGDIIIESTIIVFTIALGVTFIYLLYNILCLLS